MGEWKQVSEVEEAEEDRRTSNIPNCPFCGALLEKIIKVCNYDKRVLEEHEETWVFDEGYGTFDYYDTERYEDVDVIGCEYIETLDVICPNCSEEISDSIRDYL